MRKTWRGWTIPPLWLYGPSPADRLTERDKSLCPSCLGRAGGCVFCHASGHVCPTCRGVRFLRKAWASETINAVVRNPQDACTQCSAKGHYSRQQEMRVIAAYLAQQSTHAEG